MSTVVTEELGPRGQRRTAIGRRFAVALGLVFLAFAIWRFLERGEFSADKWAPLVDFEFGWPQFLLYGTEQQAGFEGLVATLQAAIAAGVLSVVAGLGLALLRIVKNPVGRNVMRLYIDLVRTIPLLILIFLVFLGLPQVGIRFSPFQALVLALVLYHSAVLAEVFRAGINSLPSGQSEASLAVGMTYWQSMRLVILPQAIRRMVPAIVAQLATITKDTSLGFLIGYQELLRGAQQVGNSERNNLQSFLVASVLYFIVIWFISRLASRLETEQRKKGAGRLEVAGGPEDLDAMGEDADADEVEQQEQTTTA